MTTAQRTGSGQRARNQALMGTVPVIICPLENLSEAALDALAGHLPLGLSRGARTRLSNQTITLEQRKTDVRVDPSSRARLEQLGIEHGFEVKDRPGFDGDAERAMRREIAARSERNYQSYQRRRGARQRSVW